MDLPQKIGITPHEMSLLLLLLLWRGAEGLSAVVMPQPQLQRTPTARELVKRIKVENPPELRTLEIDWEAMPKELHPKTRDRFDEQRKARAAAEAFATVLQKMKATSFLDVCAGDGDLTLPLAWALDIQGVAQDIDPKALERLEERKHELQVRTRIADVADPLPPDLKVDCVVGFRACGAVADLAIRTAVQSRTAFIISPCCLWKAMVPRSSMPAGHPDDLMYPRSRWLASVLDDPPSDFRRLATADDSPAARSSASLGGPRTPLYRRARRLIEYDRLKSAEESGFPYVTRLLRFPGSDNPLTGLLIGAPSDSPTARCLLNNGLDVV